MCLNRHTISQLLHYLSEEVLEILNNATVTGLGGKCGVGNAKDPVLGDVVWSPEFLVCIIQDTLLPLPGFLRLIPMYFMATRTI